MAAKGIASPGRTGDSTLIVLVALFVAIAVTSFVLGLSGLLAIRGQAQPRLSPWDIALGMIHIYSGQTPDWQRQGLPLPLRYKIAEVLGPVSTGYALLSGAAVLLTTQVRLLRARLARGHSIVCGGDRAGVGLVRGLAQHATAVLVNLDASSDGTSASLVRRVIPISGDPRDGLVLRRAGVQRAREIFAVAEADDVNASIALATRAAVAGRTDALSCYALVGDRDLHLTLQARILAAAPHPTFELHLIDRHQLYASAVLSREGPDPQRVTVLVGAGETAHALGMELVRYLVDHRTPPGDRPLLLLSGAGSAELVSAIAGRWTSIDDLVDVRVVDGPGVAATVRQPEGAGAGLSVFVSEAEGDRQTLRSGLVWLHQAAAAVDRVVLCMDAESGLTTAFSPSADELFAGSESALRVYSPVLALSDSGHIRSQTLNERVARRLHLVYLREVAAGPTSPGGSSPGARSPWSELPEALKFSNRNQAGEIGRKLAAVGMTIIPAGRQPRPPLTFTRDQIEALARMEHERWMAERTRSGYTLGPNRTATQHPDLVAWEDLSEAAREKDRMFVRRIPELLLAEGLETVANPALPRRRPTGG